MWQAAALLNCGNGQSRGGLVADPWGGMQHNQRHHPDWPVGIHTVRHSAQQVLDMHPPTAKLANDGARNQDICCGRRQSRVSRHRHWRRPRAQRPSHGAPLRSWLRDVGLVSPRHDVCYFEFCTIYLPIYLRRLASGYLEPALPSFGRRLKT